MVRLSALPIKAVLPCAPRPAAAGRWSVHAPRRCSRTAVISRHRRRPAGSWALHTPHSHSRPSHRRYHYPPVRPNSHVNGVREKSHGAPSARPSAIAGMCSTSLPENRTPGDLHEAARCYRCAGEVIRAEEPQHSTAQRIGATEGNAIVCERMARYASRLRGQLRRRCGRPLPRRSRGGPPRAPPPPPTAAAAAAAAPPPPSSPPPPPPPQSPLRPSRGSREWTPLTEPNVRAGIRVCVRVSRMLENFWGAQLGGAA